MYVCALGNGNYSVCMSGVCVCVSVNGNYVNCVCNCMCIICVRCLCMCVCMYMYVLYFYVVFYSTCTHTKSIYGACLSLVYYVFVCS